VVPLSPLEVVPVSAPARVAEHLRTAPDGPVRVLHHTPSALYVEVAGRCIGVVAPTAAQVPCALRVAASSPGVSPAAVLAAEAVSPYVERGTLCLTGHPLRIGRFVDVRVPRIDLRRVLGRAASPANAVARPPRPAADGLAAHSAGSALAVSALLALPALPGRIDAAILRALVGNGGGLTPLGDDVLCGWLAVLVATDRLTDDVASAVRDVVDRTTVLSATLVECALHGEVLPEFATYLAALGTPAEDDASRALTRIGHTSGAGLWWGARHALATLAMEEAA
jgi:Protein of unknown function (DUF2877)